MTRFEAELILAAHPELRAPFESYYAAAKQGNRNIPPFNHHWFLFVERLDALHLDVYADDIFWAVWNDKEKQK